ncbi:MAG: cbb3-type cytochrome c oxidase subunit 3 [Ignavibacteriales bacterium]|jgi:cbb3-type cytochrome oxidase subunit 3|nr:MAG: cbb3-type cytochrome c oxidase subunit 3 [Ignavibacteriaceae bacterium]MBW7872301.1 CcoQ/FixQ family Cbb3-type cytochrome c oxidase assembly chaperone [Ignavibacteria bacterium]MCZ2142584.1 cbb3-type cytochrome c oxidase subunit 3 [Ignavibacteriales bacterium]MBV6445552.1 hypothetical protein [Ignavibacteriaceae bacterium]MBZ0196947.1 cbb3-type cytochrome c oxidase subunit 3 [Ignavibacteriaceae bacterium]
MHKDVLSSIEGITIFPIIGLIFFAVIFGLVIYYVVKMPKKKADEMGKIPLDD